VANRISDVIAAKVEAAVNSLPVLQAVKDTVEWEISPALVPAGRDMSLAYMVAVCIPVPGSVEDDYVLRMTPLEDPHAPQAVVDALVQVLYGYCSGAADEIRARVNAQANGHRESPGGLILP
jgi:hypothetical protein